MLIFIYLSVVGYLKCVCVRTVCVCVCACVCVCLWACVCVHVHVVVNGTYSVLTECIDRCLYCSYIVWVGGALRSKPP
jgi:hypothetical protein